MSENSLVTTVVFLLFLDERKAQNRRFRVHLLESNDRHWPLTLVFRVSPIAKRIVVV